jgi:hypothetical protein
MKSTQVLFATAILSMSLSLSAQSITVTDTNNSAISPSAVVGDSLQATITGAAASSLVVLTYKQNGGSQQVFNAGYTDGTGYFQETDVVASWKIGTWYEQWSVGGTNVGANFNLEVFDKPTSLTVSSAVASSPDSCGYAYYGETGYPFGPSASVKYQINGSTGNETVPNTGLGVTLLPTETGTDYNPAGTIIGTWGPNNIGTDDPTFPWTPPSATNASSTGTFYDDPISTCATGVFSSFKTQTQKIYIKIGNFSYPVRTNTWYASSLGSGHGTLANLVDVNVSN